MVCLLNRNSDNQYYRGFPKTHNDWSTWILSLHHLNLNRVVQVHQARLIWIVWLCFLHRLSETEVSWLPFTDHCTHRLFVCGFKYDRGSFVLAKNVSTNVKGVDSYTLVTLKQKQTNAFSMAHKRIHRFLSSRKCHQVTPDFGIIGDHDRFHSKHNS